ncbi:MAG: AraC family transcriptional regulator [Sphingomonas sp.]
MATELGILLIDDFALMSYASILEPYRAANVLSGALPLSLDPLFGARGAARGHRAARRWRRRPRSPTRRTSRHCSSAPPAIPAAYDDPAVFAALRRLARHGTRLGGVSGGPWLLARAGLLDGYRCTIHWEHRPAFVEAFPGLDVENGLFVVDRDRLTCAGRHRGARPRHLADRGRAWRGARGGSGRLVHPQRAPRGGRRPSARRCASATAPPTRGCSPRSR